MSRARILAAGAAVVFLLAACGGRDEPGATTGSPSPSPSPSPAEPSGAPLSKADIVTLAAAFPDNPLSAPLARIRSTVDILGRLDEPTEDLGGGATVRSARARWRTSPPTPTGWPGWCGSSSSSPAPTRERADKRRGWRTG
jgi:hypothetical protein